MRYTLRYDDGVLDLDLGARAGPRVVGVEYPPALEDPVRAFRQAIEAPAGAKPLGALVPRTGPISVLVSDLTRGPLTGRFLALLLDWLDERGAGPDRVSVTLALGMHRGETRAELEALLGARTVGRWTVLEHDPRDAEALVERGTTAAGTPCLFNRRVATSALVIALGAVSFHYFAGYGGGRKLLLPGVAGEATILANHRLSLRADPGEGLAAGCRSGNLDGNPVHEDMLAGARLVGPPVFAVNLVGGGGGALLFASAGELDRSHRAACDYVSARFRVPLDRLYQAAVVSAGGYPADMNLLQSHKALRHAAGALDEGGVMLAATACREGIGSESLRAAFAGGRLGVPGAVRAKYTLNAQSAMSMYELTGRHSIYLRSRLSEEEVCRFGLCPWDDSFTPYLLDGIPDEDILIVADGSRFLPAYERG